MFWFKAAVIALFSAGILAADLADADGTTPLEWAVYNDDLPAAQVVQYQCPESSSKLEPKE